ncbi:MAG: phosphonate ABC transporter ATP-binding protein [Verrucomicrobiota bacterium]
MEALRSSVTPEAAIELKGVGVTYEGGFEALQPLDLQIQRGQVIVLLGRSGAGKSTLLRTMNMLVPPTCGLVVSSEFGPLTSKEAIVSHRRQTGMIFQQHQLVGRLSALRNVTMGRLSRYPNVRSLFPLPIEDRRLAVECLDRVGLLEKALQRVDRLSGGQQQRVGVARALVMRPNLLLADEPVASLDPATSVALLTLLRDICRADGITLIISLHQLDLAREFSDRIVGLSEGRCVFNDRSEKLDDGAINTIYDHCECISAPADQDADQAVAEKSFLQ